MNLRRLNSFLFKSILFIFVNLFSLSCSFFSSEPEISGQRIIEIYWPNSNSIISEGETQIEYAVTSPYNIRFIELYINGEFKQNIPAGDNNSLPKVFLNLDSTYVGKSFNYYLIYYDKDGTSLKSNDIFNVLVVEQPISPFSPYDLRLTKIGERDINISWKDSSKYISRYELFRKNGFYGEYLLLKVVEAGAFNTNDYGLIPDSIYFYKIKAYNQYGESEFSNEVNTAGIAIYGNVLPPTNLRASAFGTQVVLLEWNDNSDNENIFRIERKSLFSEFTEIGNVGPNMTFFTDFGGNLYAGGTFFYRVKVFSSKDSAVSNIAEVTTFENDLLPPAQLTASYQSLLRIVELRWINMDSRTLYFEIERKTELDNYKTIDTIRAVNSLYLDSSVEIGNKYFYRIRGYNGYNYSDYSNEIYVSTN